MSFINNCAEGNLDVAMKMYATGNIDVNDHYCLAFRYSCMYGEIETAEWLYSIGADVKKYGGIAFLYSCQRGQLEIAKWLRNLDPRVRLYDYEAFLCACENGKI